MTQSLLSYPYDTAFLRILAPEDVHLVYLEGSPAVLAVLEYLLVQHGAASDGAGHYTLPEALIAVAATYWAAHIDDLAHLRAVP